MMYIWTCCSQVHHCGPCWSQSLTMDVTYHSTLLHHPIQERLISFRQDPFHNGTWQTRLFS